MIKRFLVVCIIIFSHIDAAERDVVTEFNINESPIRVAYHAYVKFYQTRASLGLARRIFYTSSSCPDYQRYLTEKKRLDSQDKEKLAQMITDYEKSLK